MTRFAIAMFFIILFTSAPTWAANASPLGLEIGVATLDQVKKSAGSKTALTDAGINAYSGGPMLKGNGEGLDMEGLSEIQFIFDKSNKLAGVLMTLPQNDVRPLVDMLANKYKLVRKEIPFVGDAYAKFKLGASTVEVNAPHLSFTMQLNYLSDELVSSFNQLSQQERAAKEQKKKTQL